MAWSSSVSVTDEKTLGARVLFLREQMHPTKGRVRVVIASQRGFGPARGSDLPLPGRRLALRPARLLLGAMAAISAAGERADGAVMSGIVAGDAADHGAFQAAF